MKRIELTEEQLQLLINLVNLTNIRGEIAEHIVALKNALRNAQDVKKD